MLKNIRAGTDNLPSISKNTEELLRESQKTMRHVNDSLTKADEVMGNMQQATKPFADRSNSISKNLDEGTARLNTVMSDLEQLFKALDRGDGTLKKLINGEVRSQSQRNVTQSRGFTERLEAAIARYHSNAITTVQVLEELIQLAVSHRRIRARRPLLQLVVGQPPVAVVPAQCLRRAFALGVGCADAGAGARQPQRAQHGQIR